MSVREYNRAFKMVECILPVIKGIVFTGCRIEAESPCHLHGLQRIAGTAAAGIAAVDSPTCTAPIGDSCGKVHRKALP